MRFFLSALLLIAGVCLTSCHAPVRHAPNRAGPDPVLEFGFDPTPKNAEVRARLAAAALPKLAAKSSGFYLRALDHKTSLISTVPPRDEESAYTLIVNDILRKVVPVTDLCAYLEKMADLYACFNGKVVIAFNTDGLDDGNPRDTAARITAAAKRLASNPNVLGIVLVGTERDIRPGWTDLSQMLAPLKERLHVIPLSQATPEQILREVQSLRGAPVRR